MYDDKVVDSNDNAVKKKDRSFILPQLIKQHNYYYYLKLFSYNNVIKFLGLPWP
jgi:hypothetical protein